MPAENIFAAYAQPVRSVLDYLGDMDRRDLLQTQLQGAKRQNAIADLTAMQTQDQLRQSAAEREALRVAASQSGGDPRVLVQRLRATGMPGLLMQADALEKGAIERTKGEAAAGKDLADTKAKDIANRKALLEHGILSLQTAQTPQEARRQVNQGVTQGYWSMADAQAKESQIPTDQSAFEAWRQNQLRAVTEAYRQLPTVSTVDLGGTKATQAVDPFTGRPTITGQQTVTQTPESIASTGVVLQPGGPAKIDEGVLKAKQRIAAAGAARTSVNMPPAEAAFTQELAKLDAKQLDSYRDAADKSVGAVARVQAMRDAVQNGIYSGSFAGDRTKLANFFETIGAPGVDPKKLANSQEYQKHANELVLSVLKEGVGSSQISNADLQFVNETVPQLETSPLARERLLNYIEARSQANIDRFQQADAYARKNRSLGGFKPSAPATPTPKPAGGLPSEADIDAAIRRKMEGK